ncbi:MAG TPA: aminotransferase class I/II-fold pyridoxal phosphate-dependent enzyme [Kofleriaceae bacterium]|nr:aminotransferase class I/II-fold pyridoxal phosphate-dependent enzyme [Kofleriaceae bacterium]
MPLEPFALERYLAPREFRARRLLSSSDCQAVSVAELVEAADPEAREMWRDLRLGYTEAPGHPLLRREIASLYRGVDADDVLEVVPEEGIFLTMTALLKPGDHVVVTWPAYQSLHAVARSIGCRISRWEPEDQDTWRFDPARLRALVADAGAAAVVVNFPHNPTGWLPAAHEMAEIASIADAAGAWLVSDEMYRMLEHDPASRVPSAIELSGRAVSLGGLSKALSAPGLRVGWLVSREPRLRARLAELKDYTTICGSAPSEVLALMVLRARERIVARNLGLIQKSLAAVDQLVAGASGVLAWTRPRAGSVGLARLERPDASAARLCDELLAETGILLLPSTMFDYGDRHVRLGLGRAGFAEGVDELAAWLTAHR